MRNPHKKIAWIIVFVSIAAIIISSLTIGKQVYLGRELSLVSFSLIHFGGYLFFMLMPVEVLFTFYLIEDVNIIVLLILALVTAILAEIIDYAIGYLVSNELIHNIIGDKKYRRLKKYIDKYGNLTVFVFNVLPLSSSVLSLVAGMVRYKFRNFLIYSFLGLLLKYIVIVLLFS